MGRERGLLMVAAMVVMVDGLFMWSLAARVLRICQRVCAPQSSSNHLQAKKKSKVAATEWQC
jgi:hypothetical protein